MKKVVMIQLEVKSDLTQSQGLPPTHLSQRPGYPVAGSNDSRSSPE